MPQGHYKTTTVTAALRTTGLCALDLADGATNGRCFRDYVANRLVPVLRPGDTAILDHLQAHEVRGIRERVEAAGARLLYLPPYSPEFNPIEQIFAKLKALLRSAAARTVPDLWDAIRHAFARFTPDQCHNSLAAAGYDNDLAVARYAGTALAGSLERPGPETPRPWVSSRGCYGPSGWSVQMMGYEPVPQSLSLRCIR